MSDLILRSEVLTLLDDALADGWEFDYTVDRLNEIPSVSTESQRINTENGKVSEKSVNRKAGEWKRIINIIGDEVTVCSHCGALRKQGYDKYCAFCGADMRGETE